MPVDRFARGPARAELDRLVSLFQERGRPHAIVSVNGSNPDADIEVTKHPAKTATSAADLILIESAVLTDNGKARLG